MTQGRYGEVNVLAKRYRWAWIAEIAAVVLCAGGCGGGGRLLRTTPDGRPISGLQNSEREVQAFVRRAVDPRELAVSVVIGEGDVPVFINAHRPQPGLDAVAVFISPEYSRLPLIEGSLEGRAAKLLVDPTSSANWTSLDRARAYGLLPLGPPLVYGVPEHVPDSSRGALCAARSLVVDLVPVNAVLFYARPLRGPLWPLSRSADAQDADVVLGWSFLRAFEWVRWEFPARRMLFSSRPESEPEGASGATLARLRLEPGYNAPVVKGTVEGQTRLLLLDLAGEFEIAMAAPPPAPLRQVTVGDLVLRELRPAALGDLGLGFPELTRLGLRALGRYVIVLDNHRNEIRIERPVTEPSAEP
ncbi:MAG: hypothetical protein N2652_11190 [Kiritimatiellae bacterium]|nr:hypothetical protein [Kiritimatiellia bacterium]